MFPVQGSTVRLCGELDIAALADLRNAVRTVIAADHGGPVLLDMAAVRFLDAAGIGALVELKAEAVRAGRELELTNVPCAQRRLLALVRLTDAFGIRDDGQLRQA